MTDHSLIHGNRQEGSVLVIAILFLLLLTFLGLQATTTSVQEMQLATNDNDYRRLLNAAESGLSHALESLQESFLSGNQVALATAATPYWSYALVGSGHQGGLISAAAGTTFKNGIQYIPSATIAENRVDPALGAQSETYTVYIWNNSDSGSATVDTDGVIWVLSEATGPRGGRVRVAVQTVNTMTGEDVSGYTAQEGGGSGKNYNALDQNAVDTSGGITSF